MTNLLSTVVDFLEQDDWPFIQLEDRNILQTGFQGDNGQWTCFAQVREAQEQFVFYSICPVKAPEEKRPAVAEFITRANYGMIIGNFEMDFSDGEIRYKTSIDVEGGELTPMMVRTMLYTNVLMMDRYLPGIMAVIYGEESPAEAIAEIEG